MTGPDDTPDDDAMREVQGAYRELPGVEPDAALDARVRAAVAAEIASGPTAPPARRSNVVPRARWRRVALPFAAAAALLVAVGVNRLERETGPHVDTSSGSSPGPAATGGERDVAPASAPPKAVGMSAPPPPPDYKPPAVHTPLVDLPIIMGPPPAAKALRAVEPAALEAPSQQAREATNSLAAGATSDAAPALAKPATPAPSPAPAAIAAAASPADDAAAFADMRRSLAQNRRDEAIARLKRWREANPDAPLPADLKGLETDSRR